ncbi:unnamed protein product [Gongylonema pulchrum]|uniref:Nefa_Nip30_N domain-containing protein n=1 Tax=Gongylonema pulchrum TaxID=637853 RepID=A0A183D1V3_9BILA|nr:unnamed protein product [Gongylonema pulchrum]
MVRGLDEEECDFLKRVDEIKAKEEIEKKKEEEAILSEMARSRSPEVSQETTAVVSHISTVPPRLNGVTPTPSRQAAILHGAIKRKSDIEEENVVAKRRPVPSAMKVSYVRPSAYEMIGVLPGMADYASSKYVVICIFIMYIHYY